jgi:hypothetical protein
MALRDEHIAVRVVLISGPTRRADPDGLTGDGALSVPEQAFPGQRPRVADAAANRGRSQLGGVICGTASLGAADGGRVPCPRFRRSSLPASRRRRRVGRRAVLPRHRPNALRLRECLPVGESTPQYRVNSGLFQARVPMCCAWIRARHSHQRTIRGFAGQRLTPPGVELSVTHSHGV